MAWRIADNLIEGEIEDNQPGRVTGTLRLEGIDGEVELDLEGDFLGNLRGKRIRLDATDRPRPPKSRDEMRGFARRQTGYGCSADCCHHGSLHISWGSHENGRVVIELPDECWEVIGDADGEGGAQ